MSAPGGAAADAEESKKKLSDVQRQVEFAAQANHVTGLTNAEIAERVAKYGLNVLPEKKKSKILMFLSYLWGPMPIAIWIAVIIEIIRAAIAKEDYEGFAVLLVLQFANAIIGFIEESNAGDAIAALKSQLAPQCHVCREGKWLSMPAKNLVPGDLIELKLGDVVPADAILLEGQPVQADQSALTGESLPATIHPWGHLKMGSAIKRGESKAIVSATGANTFFGTAAAMISSVNELGNLAKILLHITTWLLALSLTLCIVIFAVLMATPDPDGYVVPSNQSKIIRSLSVTIVILVASIPIAIEVVCTSTLAVGSHIMAKKKVIVAKLSAIEELAGMTILCSDKTGTLTLNKLSLREPIVLAEGAMPDDITFFGALASKRESSNQDAIDFCITRGVAAADVPFVPAYHEAHFVPFNPTDKRTIATVEGPERARMRVTPGVRLLPPGPAGERRIRFRIAKGAPQAILRICERTAALDKRVNESVQELADRGFRSLGVAVLYDDEPEPTQEEIAAAAVREEAERSKHGGGGHHRQAAAPTPGQGRWQYLGILSLFDPPRPDTKATIAAAIVNGIEVKMITGDQTAIAKETCRQLGMGPNILDTTVLNDTSMDQARIDKIIMEAHGFAEVLPEHKFQVVERIRKNGHVTGMTGDGVNDAPALKRADIGIAVHGATDAARAAADIVLTEEGLSVIIEAIFESRKIFQRMRNYIIYRIACTLQLLCFFFIAIIAVSPDAPSAYNYNYGQKTSPYIPNPSELAHAPSFTLPIIALVIITILNDGCMITIAYDHVVPEVEPQKWALWEVWLVAVTLGVVALVSSVVLLVGCMQSTALNPGGWGVIWGSEGRNYILFAELRTIIYLKISLSDFLTLFSARTSSFFWQRGLGRALGIAACVAMGTSTIFSLVWGDFISVPSDPMASLRFSNGAVIATWIYCILWWFLQDAVKVLAYWLIETRLRSPENRAQRARVQKHAHQAYPMPRAHTGATPSALARQYDEDQIAAEIAADLEEGGHVARNPLNKDRSKGSFHWMGAGPRQQGGVSQWGGAKGSGRGAVITANPLAIASSPGHV